MDFSRGRSDGLIYPSLSEFSTVYCDPHSQRLCIVYKEEIDVFLEFSYFFDDPVDVGNLISGSSSFSKTSLNIWKFTDHVLLKADSENFEHCFTSVWDECNCAVVWAFFGIAFLWDQNENWPFPVPRPLIHFPNLQACWVQHFHSIIFRLWNSSTGIPSLPLALFVVMLAKAHLNIPDCLALGEWSHHHDCLGHEDHFCTVLCILSCHLFLISSASFSSTLFLSFIVSIFAWNVPLVSLIFLERSLVFPILWEGFLISPCYSLERCIKMDISFLFSFAFHFSFHSYL